MKFKFITEARRRAMMMEATEGGKPLTFIHFNGRRFVVEDDIIYLVEGLDEIIGERVFPAPLTADEVGRVTEILKTYIKQGD